MPMSYFWLYLGPGSFSSSAKVEEEVLFFPSQKVLLVTLITMAIDKGLFSFFTTHPIFLQCSVD
jgi:hypothetical protein